MWRNIFKKYRRQKRLKKIGENLPDCFTMIANAMKSGLSLPQALQIASLEGPSPLNEELKSILEKVKLGRSLEEALLAHESQLRLSDFSLMVHSIIILSQIGGNFVLHFENLARILRERQKVTSKIQLLTAQGLSQGVILGLLPVGLGVSIYFLSPDFISPLWETPLGFLTIGFIFILDFGGWLWMKQLAKIEI